MLGDRSMDVTPYCSIMLKTFFRSVTPSTKMTEEPLTRLEYVLLRPWEWLVGIGIISTLSDFILTPYTTFSAMAMSLPWVRTMPFDFPVVPVENRISHTSSLLGKSIWGISSFQL